MYEAKKTPVFEQEADQDSQIDRERRLRDPGRVGLRLVAPEIIPVLETEISDSAEIQPPEGLSETQIKYFKFVSTLIQQPNFRFMSPNAGFDLTILSGLEPGTWDALNQKLTYRQKVIGLIKKQGHQIARIPDGIYLNLDGLINFAPTQKKNGYITNDLLALVKDRLNGDDIDLSTEEKAAYATRISEILQQRATRQKNPEQLAQKYQEKLAQQRQSRAKLSAGKRAARETARQQKLREREQKRIEREQRQAERERGRQESNTRRSLIKGDFLRFELPTTQRSDTITYRLTKFDKVGPEHRVLLAIGHSSSFSKSIEQQKEYVLRILNKLVSSEESHSIESAENILDGLIQQGLVLTGENKLLLAAASLDILNPRKEKAIPAEKEVKNEDQEDENGNSNSRRRAQYRVIDDILAYRGLESSGQILEWHHPPTNKTSIIKELDNVLDLHEKHIRTRLDDLEKVGFAESQTNNNGEKINYRFTKAGIDFWQAVRNELVEKGVIIDDSELEAVVSMIKTCKELATKLDNAELISALNQVQDERYLGDLEPQDFQREATRIEQILEQLRKDYAHAFAIKKPEVNNTRL